MVFTIIYRTNIKKINEISGENLKDTYFVAKTKVEVLAVPKVNFAKVGKSKTLELMRENLNKYLPSNEVLFKNYFSGMKWRQYKVSLCFLVKILDRNLGGKYQKAVPDFK